MWGQSPEYDESFFGVYFYFVLFKSVFFGRIPFEFCIFEFIFSEEQLSAALEHV